MSQLTSPDDYSSVKPTLSIETIEVDDDSASNIDDIGGLISEAVILFQDINKDYVIDPLYKPEFMEINGTYVHNIEMPLIFTYGAEPGSICNVNKYKRKGPAVTTNALCFKDLLEACMVAGSSTEN